MYPFLKRFLDFVISLSLILVLSPLLIALVIAIKLESAGPVLYRGLRVGRKGKKFSMLKFRTMVLDADKAGSSSTPEDDPRITKTGKFLRRYKLDELPQLFNVLKGEMSLVGPRPQVEWAVKLYSDKEKALLDVPPGVTDYASLRFRNEGEILKGSLDPDKDYLKKIAPEKIRLGLEYVKTASLGVDLKILAATAWAALGKDPNEIIQNRN